MRFSYCTKTVTVAVLLFFASLASAQAGIDVGTVTIYDASVLGDTSVILDDSKVSMNSESPPALLLPYLDGPILTIPSLQNDPIVGNDCDVVEQWPEIMQFFSDAESSLGFVESSFEFNEADAQGALDLAISLLDSVNAPTADQCDEDIHCKYQSFSPVPFTGEPCIQCTRSVFNVAVAFSGMEVMIMDMAKVRDKALDLVNEVVAKLANPFSFEAEDYACDRVCAEDIQEKIDGLRNVFEFFRDLVMPNIENCTLEVAMAECENNCPDTSDLLGKVGPIISSQLATGAFQSIEPARVLGGIVESLEQVSRTGNNRRVNRSLRLVARRLQDLAGKGNVLHAVIPVAEDTSATFVAIGHAKPRDDGGEGWESTRPLSAVVITVVQRDSGLPIPNFNDFRKIQAARRAFALRVPHRSVTTFQDLERNTNLDEIVPEWRQFFAGAGVRGRR